MSTALKRSIRCIGAAVGLSLALGAVAQNQDVERDGPATAHQSQAGRNAIMRDVSRFEKNRCPDMNTGEYGSPVERCFANFGDRMDRAVDDAPFGQQRERSQQWRRVIPAAPRVSGAPAVIPAGTPPAGRPRRWCRRA